MLVGGRGSLERAENGYRLRLERALDRLDGIEQGPRNTVDRCLQFARLGNRNADGFGTRGERQLGYGVH